jgi:hypothetical protein
VDVIDHQMPFFDPALFLLRQSPEHFSEVLPQVPV